MCHVFDLFLAVQHPCQAIESKDVDLLAWLLERPHFADAWSHYEKPTEAPPFFDLYVHAQ
jgi:hypothetical protein